MNKPKSTLKLEEKDIKETFKKLRIKSNLKDPNQELIDLTKQMKESNMTAKDSWIISDSTSRFSTLTLGKYVKLE